MRVKNGAGKVYYGLHFCPGVAEYAEPDKDPYRIFINEDTIRKMNPTFAGRPIYVEHVDEVPEDLDEIRNEADGWVMESFYNPADGKTWAKFIVVTKRAERAIKNGYKLSNAYIPKNFGAAGLWNGVNYAKEVTDGEFEHMGIVKKPRYAESQILTPEEFKRYNEEREIELIRIANSEDQSKETPSMKLNFFKRTKVENSADFEGVIVTLPKSGKEVSVTQLVTDADAATAEAGKPRVANAMDMFGEGEAAMSVGDLAKKVAELEAKIAALSAPVANEDEEGEAMENEEDEAGREEEIAEKKKNEDAEKAAKAAEEKKKNSADAAAKAKAKKENFEALKNAHNTAEDDSVSIDLAEDQVERGKARYGS
jgi:chemotaxis protein histidine kinase CheA